ncbi:MAG TPA: GNAT family N-acetyltransferase [Chloroflexia bacterium]|nr:GNAT family N-acetyltransferase [Chloroflexia bacterium]
MFTRKKPSSAKDPLTAEQPDNLKIKAGKYSIRPLRGIDHWSTVGHMFINYPGVDSYFEQVLTGRLKRNFLRWVGMPFYFWTVNDGYGLWLEDGSLAGQIYLQYRQMVTHINDIEVNRTYQGLGLSHVLLDWAEKQAHLRKKDFMTLAVTLSNSRAANLYRASGYLEQHHRYFYLSRPWWSEAKDGLPPGSSRGVKLAALDPRAARRNLRYFFELETEVGEPLTAPVWKKLYQPGLPGRGQGFSFALHFEGMDKPQGHADFFDWNGRGRWRIYVEPSLWGTGQERALFETLLHQSRSYTQLGLMLGTTPHHRAALQFTRNLGLIERDTERMLMIKPLFS